MQKSIDKKIDKETWRDRLRKTTTKEEIERIFVTESRRVFSEGQYDSAKGRATHKKWHTQEDEKVRDTHWYLDGLEVKIDDYFYTLSGDRAMHPLGFGIASEDVNCRCFLEYIKKE